jgi:hypothetical protein
VETRTCAHDAEHKENRTLAVDPNNHDWNYLGTAPTCTETGSGTRTCKLCDETEADDDIPPLGHDHGEWHTIKEPDCTATGTKELRCIRDGFLLDTGTISALGHDWDDWEFNAALSSGEIRACKRESGHTETHAFYTSTANMGTYLTARPSYNASTPYTVALNVSDLGGSASTAGSVGYVLATNRNKYVFLDLSGSTITEIPSSAIGSILYDIPLTGIIIPNSVTSIGDMAFSRTSLTSVTIPDSVTSIGDMAFYGCTSLSSIDVGAANTAYSSHDGVLYNKNKTVLVVYPEGKMGDFTIPNSVTSIGDRAFYDCTSLSNVTIPNSITSIGDRAFSGCTSLTSVTIPHSVTSIGDDTFSRCRNLIGVTIGNGVTSIGEAAFSQCTSLGNVTIPNSVTSIGYAAFHLCRNLVGVTIGNGVTSIGEWAFFGCTNLTDITIPDSVTSIGKEAFRQCTSLGSITIGKGVTSTGEAAFSQCTSLSSVTIPDNVTSIAGGSFYSCTSLSSVTIGNGVTVIELGAFQSCSNLTDITIPDSVTGIEGGAFYACTSLISVTFEGTIDSDNFGTNYFGIIYLFPFDGDLKDVFYATDAANGTPGTYTTTAPVNESSVWTKKP